MKYLILAILLMSSYAKAEGGLEGVYTIVIKKQEEKKKSRWSIYDWLATKQKIKLMDHWLAMNSSDTVFEGFLGGQFFEYERDGVESINNTSAELGLFYSIFGIQGGWVGDAEDTEGGWHAGLYLRLLGTSLQNTNLTIGGGLQTREESFNSAITEFQNTYAEAELTFYIIDFLGINGQYRWFFENEVGGLSLDVSKWSAGVFLEFSVFRFYAQLFEESLKFTQSGTTTENQRKGLIGGLRLFF